MGNIGDAEKLFINNQPIKIYKDGIFVHVVSLEYGENRFELKAVLQNGESKTLMYNLIRPQPVQNISKPAISNLSQLEVFGNFIRAEITKNYVPLRADSSENSARLIHLSEGTVIYLDAKKGSYYRVFANADVKYWVKNTDFRELGQVAAIEPVQIKHFRYSYDDDFEYFSFRSNSNLLCKTKETENGVNVEIYNVLNQPKKLEKYVQSVKFQNNTLSFFVPHQKLWGYDCYYNGNNLVFRLTRGVNPDTHNPLKNIVIALDAGHGGKDGGAIGPTRVREADIALDVTLRLRDILRKEGAKVVLTRDKNDYVGLYERIDKIKAANPLFSISIHANALPDGADPFVRYGTSVYYYHPQAKEFAQMLKQTIVGQMSTRDDGTRYASFVLNRESSPISVLIETAYMINPDDYINLLNPNFRQNLAQSIADGIRYYLNSCIPK